MYTFLLNSNNNTKYCITGKTLMIFSYLITQEIEYSCIQATYLLCRGERERERNVNVFCMCMYFKHQPKNKLLFFFFFNYMSVLFHFSLFQHPKINITLNKCYTPFI